MKLKPSRKVTKRMHSTEEPDSDAETSLEQDRKRVRWNGEADDVMERNDADLESESEEQESIGEKTYLAVTCQFGRVGGAFYDPVTTKIYVLEDSQESPRFDLTQLFLEQADPDVALVSSKADDGCIDVVKGFMDTNDGTFQIRPFKEFLPSKGRDRVLALPLLALLPTDGYDEAGASNPSSDSEPTNAYDFMRRAQRTTGDPTTQKWNASIRLSNHAAIEHTPLCLGSLGALLDHMTRVRAVGELADEGIDGLNIRDIESVALKEVMQINLDALFSLQVFDNENHASIHSDKTKEGLSLFGMLNNTMTTLGKALLRQWLLRPSMSVPVINARHDAVACFVRPDNIRTADTMHSHLKGIRNLPKILAAMKCGKARLSDWQGLVKFAFHTVMLRDAVSELNHAGHVLIVQKLSEALQVASFKDIGSSVNAIVDWEESAISDRICVRHGVDEDLDKYKRIFNGIDPVLSKAALQVSANIPVGYVNSLNVVYFPQLGFLVCVDMLDEWKAGEEITVLDGWSFQFSSEEHVYFKSQEMRDLDKHIGDMQSTIVDREIEIIQSTAEQIMAYETAMIDACDVCAELDCLLSFAEASRAYNYVRPNMVEENVTIIRDGRHPLQELVVDTFVPNDAYIIGSDHDGTQAGFADLEGVSENSMYDAKGNCVLICTGANACGKSVYLKQVALIHYMAQIGCFVPAASATLGVLDKIFTRIQTRESVSKVQSAFMIDLNQVSLALRHATSRSLILLDEFGKGTIATDGAGLFCGIVKHMLSRGTDCPKVLAATHFHELFRDDIMDIADLPITFTHMQVILTSSRGEVFSHDDVVEDDSVDYSPSVTRVNPGERITYLYRIAKGLSLHSHAAMCAELFGIPPQIVERARYVSHLLEMHEIGVLLDEEMTEDERQDLADAEEVCRKFLAWNLEDARGGPEGGVKEMLRQVMGRDTTE